MILTNRIIYETYLYIKNNYKDNVLKSTSEVQK